MYKAKDKNGNWVEGLYCETCVYLNGRIHEQSLIISKDKKIAVIKGSQVRIKK